MGGVGEGGGGGGWGNGVGGRGVGGGVGGFVHGNPAAMQANTCPAHARQQPRCPSTDISTLDYLCRGGLA